MGNLNWINHPGLDQVAQTHQSTNAPFVPGVLGNLVNGFFEHTLYDFHPNGFVVVELALFSFNSSVGSHLGKIGLAGKHLYQDDS